MAKKAMGKNIQYEIENDVLTLTVNLAAATSPSASGKTDIIATSQGNKKIEGDVVIGLNIYKKKGA